VDAFWSRSFLSRSSFTWLLMLILIYVRTYQKIHAHNTLPLIRYRVLNSCRTSGYELHHDRSLSSRKCTRSLPLSSSISLLSPSLLIHMFISRLVNSHNHNSNNRGSNSGNHINSSSNNRRGSICLVKEQVSSFYQLYTWSYSNHPVWW